jgi:hypothetical protein
MKQVPARTQAAAMAVTIIKKDCRPDHGGFYLLANAVHTAKY